MDTCCESRFYKKVFWKIKVPTADPIADPTDAFKLLIGPVELSCYLGFRKKSYYDPNKIGLNLTLQSSKECGDKTIFKRGTNVSTKVEIEIVGTKRITRNPSGYDDKIDMGSSTNWHFTLPVSYEEIKDLSSGYIVDGMFTFFTHVELYRWKCPTGSCFQEALTRAFGGNKEMFLKELMADFEIETNDKVFKVNKFALASRSPVFFAMFSNYLEETRSGRMKVSDIESNVMEELLRYIYCNEVEDLNLIVGDLALAANKYQVGALQELCSNHMSISLNVENVLEFLAIAYLLNEMKLMKECLDMIGCIKDILSLTPEWGKLTPQLLKLVGQYETNMGASNTSIRIYTRR